MLNWDRRYHIHKIYDSIIQGAIYFEALFQYLNDIFQKQ